MPVTRTPAHQTMVSFHNAGELSLQSYEAHPYKGTTVSTNAPTRDAPVTTTIPPTIKRRRSPNAFILFRSFIIANKLFPPEITHQNDISRYIAELWRSASASDRSVFFRNAEQEKLRFALEGPGEVYRKKRVRTRKARSSNAVKLVTPIDLSEDQTIASKGSLSPLTPSNISPSSYSCSLNPPPPVTCPRFISLPASLPIAPQPRLAIPPSLLNWGRPGDADASNTNNLDFRNSADSLTMGPSPFSSLPYQIHADPRASSYMSLMVEINFCSTIDSMISSQMFPHIKI